MPRQERSWEQRYQRDGELSQSAGCALGASLVLVQMLTMVVIGFTFTGLVVGAGLGLVVVVLLARLVVRSQKPLRRSPPKDLL